MGRTTKGMEKNIFDADLVLELAVLALGLAHCDTGCGTPVYCRRRAGPFTGHDGC